MHREQTQYKYFLERYGTLSFNLVGGEFANGEVISVRKNFVKAKEQVLDRFDIGKDEYYDITGSYQQ